MARLPALIDDLAAHDPRGRPTVELIARNIREAGLITTTKRGRGAAEMTARDAAALLIGLCCSDGPKDAADAVRKFSSLVSDPESMNEMTEEDFPEAVMQMLSSTTLVDCFESFIKEPHFLQKCRTVIVIRVTLLRASIAMIWTSSTGSKSFNHSFIGADSVEAGASRPHRRFDCVREARLAPDTFRRLHQLLSGNGEKSIDNV